MSSPPPGYLPDPEIEPESPALQADSLATGKAPGILGSLQRLTASDRRKLVVYCLSIVLSLIELFYAL